LVDASRRELFKKMGITMAGAGVIGASALKSVSDHEAFKKIHSELEELSNRFDELDSRTKWLVKIALTYTGIDFLTDVASIIWLGND
jgi:hypothetical protein